MTKYEVLNGERYLVEADSLEDALQKFETFISGMFAAPEDAAGDIEYQEVDTWIQKATATPNKGNEK